MSTPYKTLTAGLCCVALAPVINWISFPAVMGPHDTHLSGTVKAIPIVAAILFFAILGLILILISAVTLIYRKISAAFTR
jgi:hypothetical protein